MRAKGQHRDARVGVGTSPVNSVNYQAINDLALFVIYYRCQSLQTCMFTLGCHKPEHAEVISLRLVNEQ